MKQHLFLLRDAEGFLPGLLGEGFSFIVKVQREQSNVVILSSGLKLTGMFSFVRIGFILLGHLFIHSLSPCHGQERRPAFGMEVGMKGIELMS